MAQQIKKKFIAPDAIDGSKIKLQEGEALRLQTPGGVVELLKKDADGNLVSEGNEISFKADMEAAVSTEESARIAAVSAEASARMAADESLEVKIDFITSNIDGDAIDSLTEMLSAFQSADSDLNNAISQLAGAAGGNLSAEIVARESAISAEASAREAAVSAEIAARESADDSLESALSVEVAARESADLSLESDLDAEISAREAAVSAEIVARESAMSVEVAARESADEDLQDQIDTEKGRIDAILLAADADKDSFAEIVSLINSVDTENDNAFAAAVLSLQSADSAEASARDAEDLTFVKLNGSRAMSGPLNMGGGTPFLQTSTKNTMSTLSGTRQSLVTASSDAFGTQSGGDYDGQDYVDLTISQQDYDSLSTGMFIFVYDFSNPSSKVQSSIVHKEVIDAENNIFRFYVGGLVLNSFNSPALVTIEFKSAPKVSINYSWLLTTGFDATQENFKLELVTTGSYFAGPSGYTKITLAEFVGGVDGGSWIFIDPNYISGTPTISSAGLVEYFEAQSLSDLFNPQRIYTFTEKVLSSSNSKITNLASGTTSSDAANYGQVLSVSSQATNIQNELNTTQTGAGLQFNGAYISKPMANFISSATSLASADDLLDIALFAEQSARQDADTAEASARESAMSAEIAARESADLSLESNLDAEISAREAAVSAEIVARESAMSVEVAARESADLSLHSALSAETAARESADTAEASARMAGDQSLQSQIDNVLSNIDPAALDSLTEIVSAFQSADSDLNSAISQLAGAAGGNLSAEIVARESADASLHSALSVETAARESADTAEASARTAAISAEIVARESAVYDLEVYDLDLRSDLDEEISARESADLSLHSALSVETAARESADTAEASARAAAMSAEIAARESADLSLHSALSVETAARESADTAEASARAAAMSAEIAARESADTALDGKIDTEKGRIDAILLAADADKDSFAEIVSLINSVDTENDNAFASAVLSLQSADTAEASIRAAAVSAEIVARVSADDSLESALSVETAARESADTAEASARAAAVSAEASARTAADLSLESVIDNLDGYAQDLRSDLDAEESARIAEDLTFFKKDGSREMTGSIIPSVTLSFDIGSPTKRFKDIYLSGNTIDLGGVTLSNESSEFVVRDASNNELAIVSDNVREGSVNKFFTESRVQETEMSMLDVTKSGEVASTDSLIDAVSKLQSQITLEISDREDDVDAEESARVAAVSAEASARAAADDMLDMRLMFLEGQVLESDLMFEVGVNGVTTSSIVLPNIASKIYKVCIGRLNVFKNVDYTIGTEMVMVGGIPSPKTKLTWTGELASNGASPVGEGDKIFISYLYNG